jgi:hypothetical protein
MSEEDEKLSEAMLRATADAVFLAQMVEAVLYPGLGERVAGERANNIVQALMSLEMGESVHEVVHAALQKTRLADRASTALYGSAVIKVLIALRCRGVV